MEMSEDVKHSVILGNDLCKELDLLQDEVISAAEESEDAEILDINDLHVISTDIPIGSLKCGESGSPKDRSGRRGIPDFSAAKETSWGKNDFVRETVEELMEKGVISWSHSPWASPVMIAPKKGTKGRMCIDYRRVNRIIKHDRFPLPRIH
ncbi:hypothetical protein ADUPG1_000874 [Aduncisulcus paluster]|uniref:Reverse transcriptase n=1 Tax=Aduncisulcus paluster TaxID=2918883 RepID=A0ABQ5K8C3_9EUKA|nr:hypothetical protein ADUPG1_000874 [Aduncisulcus paluster]